ncbi:GntR family transcriptional regulator, partial [Nocardia sp. NPDC059236]
MAADNQAREVKFRRIAGDLRRAIRGGEYAPGDRIPGENALMAEYGVARMTARQALGVLVDEGLTEPRKGKGVFVRDVRPTVRRVVQRLSREQWGAGRSVWESETEGRDLVVD